MKNVYIAVGHGKTPSGAHDSGAVAGSTTEYDLARHTVAGIEDVLGLHKKAIRYRSEQDEDRYEDPDYVGTVARVNAGNYDLAVEVHYDWDQAPRGGFGCYVSDSGLRLAKLVAARYKKEGYKTRPNTKRPGLFFLNGTDCPALLWECDRVGKDISHTRARSYGRRIGLGILDFYGVKA